MKKKINKDMINELCSYIAMGLSNKDACAIANISETAFYDWIERGNKEIDEEKGSIYTLLVESLKKANAQFKQIHLQKILQASDEDWKASAWTLERKCPDEFGRIDRNKIGFDEESGLQIQIINDVPNNDNNE